MTRIVIGRNSPDLELTDIMISRFHARLKQAPDGSWTVRDLASRNGTLVNGERIDEPVILQPGDEINVGYTVLQFAVVADDVNQPATRPDGEPTAQPADALDDRVTVDENDFVEVDRAGAESVGAFAQALDAVPDEPEGGYEDDEPSYDQPDDDERLVSSSGADELLTAFPLKEDAPPVPQSAFEDTDPPASPARDQRRAQPDAEAAADDDDGIDEAEHQETMDSGPILDDDNEQEEVTSQAARDHAAAIEAFFAVEDGDSRTATQVESRAVKAARAGDEAAADCWADALQKEIDVAQQEGWPFDTRPAQTDHDAANTDADHTADAAEAGKVNERVRKLLDQQPAAAAAAATDASRRQNGNGQSNGQSNAGANDNRNADADHEDNHGDGPNDANDAVRPPAVTAHLSRANGVNQSPRRRRPSRSPG